MSDLAEAYAILAEKLEKGEKSEDVWQVVQNTDSIVTKTLKFLIEHLVLPHIANLERKVN